MEHTDRLWPGGPAFLWDDGLFRPGTDTFLLGAFPRLKRGEEVCDLGSGTGLLGLLLLAREPSLHVTGVEVQEAASALARRTAEMNGLAASLTCLTADLRDPRLLTAGGFDLVISNPPYFSTQQGATAPDDARRTARSEESCTLEDIFRAARRLLRWGGRLCLVHRPERLCALMTLSSRYGLEPKRLRFVHHTPHSAPSLLLLECRRGGKSGLQVEPPLLLQESDGTEGRELRSIYFRDRG